MGWPTAQLTFDLGWGRVLLQLDSDDLLDNPGEAQSAFYEGPGVSGPAGSFPVIAQLAHSGSQREGGPEGKTEGVTLSPGGTLWGGGQGQSLRAVLVEVGLAAGPLWPCLQATRRRRGGSWALALAPCGSAGAEWFWELS